MPHGQNDQLLDLVFVLDCTGSMGPYIREAEKSINAIVDEISKSGYLADDEDLQVGLVAYRDDDDFRDFIARPTALTNNINSIKDVLKHLGATGGGDGPEAVMTALDTAINTMTYRPKAHRILIQITDAPPHGIGEKDDKHPGGDPPSQTSYDIFRDLDSLLTTNLISWFVIRCEPTMSSTYDYATIFYDAMTTGHGRTISLGQSGHLAKAVIGLALESLDLDTVLEDLEKELSGATTKISKLSLPAPEVGISLLSIAEPEKYVAPADMKKIFQTAKSHEELQTLMKSQRPHPEDALKKVHSYFTERGTKVTTVKSSLKYSYPQAALDNMKVFRDAKSHGDVRGKLKTHPRVVPSGTEGVEVSSEPISPEQVRRLAKRYKQKYRS